MKEDPEELFFYIASKNCTEMKARRKEIMRIGFSSNRFNPGRRIRDQRSAKDSTEEKIYGQGGRKGEERQKGKGTNCGAHFTYKLFPCMHGQGHEKEKEGNGDYFNLSVRIRYEHNHAINLGGQCKSLCVCIPVSRIESISIRISDRNT